MQRTGYGSSSEGSEISEKFARLHKSLDTGDADGVQKTIFHLSAIHNGWTEIPDEVVESLLTLLRNEAMYKSDLAGHVLSFFEFEASNLTARQKSLCIGFLNTHGDKFTHVRSQQVVVELRNGPYLAPSN